MNRIKNRIAIIDSDAYGTGHKKNVGGLEWEETLNKFTCDVCGTHIPSDDGGWINNLNNGRPTSTTKSICTDCMNEFEEILKKQELANLIRNTASKR